MGSHAELGCPCGVAEVGGCALDDVQLRLPLRAAEVPLLNGFDTNGGRRPREVRWRWDACYLVITPALVS